MANCLKLISTGNVDISFTILRSLFLNTVHEIVLQSIFHYGLGNMHYFAFMRYVQ